VVDNHDIPISPSTALLRSLPSDEGRAGTSAWAGEVELGIVVHVVVGYSKVEVNEFEAVGQKSGG